jgi:poly(A) polymerase
MAAERVQSELVKLLSARQAHPQVATMAQVGLLDVLFPELISSATIQRQECHEDLVTHALHTHRALETLINSPASVVPMLAEPITQYVQMGDRAPLLKWAALLHGIGPATAPLEGQETPPSCRSDAGRAAEIWQQVAGRFKLSRARTDYVGRIIAHHHRPFELATLDAQGGLTLRLIHQWYKELGEDVLGVFVLAIAEALAHDPGAPHADAEPALERLAARLWRIYRGRILPVLQGPRLVTGDDLQSLFGLSPGPLFKTLLAELEVAQVEGHIGTREEALQWLQAHLPRR